MNQENCQLASGLVSRSYISQGTQALSTREKLVKTLLSQRRMPETGWDEPNIEGLIQDLALMDSNNFLGNVGVGEREARSACPLVARRHYRLAHGIGRSGDIAAEQPKARLPRVQTGSTDFALRLSQAAGSSLLARLTNLLAADALRLAGLADLGPVTVLPLATGMAMTLTLLALKAQRPAHARSVLWPRIDQRTCLKCIATAGLTPDVISMARIGDQLVTDLSAVQARLEELGPEAIVCVISTTSCFAPRAADDVLNIAALCQRYGVPHMVNNAYGVQSAELCRKITAASRRGRVDAVVQSTDKNFMVPVGGAIVAAPRSRPDTVGAVNQLYPGRACMAPLLDLLMTLLHWGVQGWQRVLQEREHLFTWAKQRLQDFAQSHGERVLETPGNPISMAITVDHVLPPGSKESITMLGSMLFNRFASGVRVIGHGKTASVAGVQFQDYGAHCDDSLHEYLTVAAALGTTREDIDGFLAKLDGAIKSLKRRES